MTTTDTPTTDRPTTEKVTFTNARGEELSGRLERPVGKPLATAIFAHCFTCSKDIAAATRIARALSARGFAVLRFDFTGLGHSEGEFANTNFSSNVADLVSAADHLRAIGLPPKLLVGHSLGGAAVLVAADRIPDVEAMVAINAPSEPAHVEHLLRGRLDEIEAAGEATVSIGGRDFRIQRQFLDDLEGHELRRSLGDTRKALLVLHAPEDELVDIDHARRLFQAAKHPKSFVALDGADHLLSDRRDAEYAATVLAAWASRYVLSDDAPLPTDVTLDADADPQVARGHVVVSEHGGRYDQTITAGPHRWTAGEPPAVGGADAGPSPYELLLASLGACTSMTLRMYAERKAWPLDHVEVRLDHRKDDTRRDAHGRPTDHIARELVLTGALDDEQRARLLEIADRCPVHRTLESDPLIETTLTVGDAADDCGCDT